MHKCNQMSNKNENCDYFHVQSDFFKMPKNFLDLKLFIIVCKIANIKIKYHTYHTSGDCFKKTCSFRVKVEMQIIFN